MGPQPEESAAGQPGDPRDAGREKQAAAEAAAELVENGMTVGLGTGRFSWDEESRSTGSTSGIPALTGQPAQPGDSRRPGRDARKE